MKIKINILVSGGAIQAIMADSVKDTGILMDFSVFDADNDKEVIEDFEEITRTQQEFAF